MPAAALTVWTIGHSTRALDAFLDLLRAQEIEAIADVRRHAGSRKYPHFNPDVLADSLAQAGIAYVAFPDLGGRRQARPDSPHTVWRNASFRGYADYMDTPAFARAYARLVELAGQRRTALLCAEAVWWRCHRSMISDALKAHGACVLHIMEGGRTEEHPYTAAARVVNGELRYGAEQGQLPL